MVAVSLSIPMHSCGLQAVEAHSVPPEDFQVEVTGVPALVIDMASAQGLAGRGRHNRPWRQWAPMTATKAH